MPVAPGLCPNCNTPLERVSYTGPDEDSIEVDECVECMFNRDVEDDEEEEDGARADEDADVDVDVEDVLAR